MVKKGIITLETKQIVNIPLENRKNLCAINKIKAEIETKLEENF